MELTNQNKDRKKSRRPAIDISTMVYGKVPPQAKDMEEAVLGAVLVDSRGFEIASELLKPECFYVDAHQRIFRACTELNKKYQPIDMLTVT
jgi:replicative DNA helicase